VIAESDGKLIVKRTVKTPGERGAVKRFKPEVQVRKKPPKTTGVAEMKVDKKIDIPDSTMQKQDILQPSPSMLEDVGKYIEEKVLECVCDVLEMKIENIDAKKQFSDYGVDSILSVDLIKKINQSLDIVLKTITLFDYTNVQDLCNYIYNEYGPEISQRFRIRDVNSDLNDPGFKISQPGSDNDVMGLLQKLEVGELSINEVINKMEINEWKRVHRQV
jgi:acyl carrier protein